MISIDELKEELRKRDIEVLPDVNDFYIPFNGEKRVTLVINTDNPCNDNVDKIVNRLIDEKCKAFVYFAASTPSYIRAIITKHEKLSKYRSITEPFNISFWD
jgi:hypothetical protein